MRLAVLTDIHGNREAFAAVLEDAHARGATDFALLGDIVGYGPDPGWCIDRAAALQAAGAICLRGNHDNAAAGADESLNGTARAALDWTRAQISTAEAGFLGSLPFQARLGEVLFTHASANNPGDWNYVTSDTAAAGSFRASDARIMLCGHVHRPLLVSRDMAGHLREQPFRIGMALPLIRSRRWLAVIGSVGQPRDGVAQAGYALLQPDTAELTFLRVPYDVDAVVRKTRAAGLPSALADRLLRGE